MRISILFLLLFLATGASAAEINAVPKVPPYRVHTIRLPTPADPAQQLPAALPDDGNCLTSDLLYTGNYAAATVKKDVPQLHFIRSGDPTTPDCPSLAASCSTDTFVLAGDEVLVTRAIRNGLACAHYVSPKGKTSSGWVDRSALVFQNDGPVRFSSKEAYGLWVNGLTDSRIKIAAAKDDYVAVEGDATRGPPSYNTGSFKGFASIDESRHGLYAGFDGMRYRGEAPALAPVKAGTTCRVRLRFAGHYMLADDNNGCGGFGVSFSGAYVRGDLKAAKR